MRTAHRCTTTHFGGDGAKNVHKKNIAQAPLDGKLTGLPEPFGRKSPLQNCQPDHRAMDQT
jgi:hypothetical protein